MENIAMDLFLKLQDGNILLSKSIARHGGKHGILTEIIVLHCVKFVDELTSPSK